MTSCFRPALLSLALAFTSASAAAQADSALAVSSGGASLMRLNTDASFVVRGTEGAGGLPAAGAGVRLMWFPARAAFRAGRVGTYDYMNGSTYWDLDNIGVASTAFGTNSRATGTNSFAVGNGSHGAASGGIALGANAQAMGDDALALGPSSIAGGLASITIGPSIANGNFSVAIGLQNSASGQFSVAIGKNARTANRQGSVVLGDACASFSSDSVYATADNQFVVRGCGGIKMYTSQNLSSGVEVAPGGGSWSSVSDRNRKENLLFLDGEDVLARLRTVPVSTWNYLSQERSVRHMGPMAQDFRAAFGLGESDLLINSMDIDGVNMAAAQALEARTAAQRQRIDALEAQNAAQARELAEMRARMERLEALVTAGQGAVRP
jgi:uncharacterized coiled-coil protein SlyX